MQQWLLPARVDRATVEVLAPQWHDALTDQAVVTVDASMVERIGQAGWQLLVSAGVSADRIGIALRIVKPSEALIQSARYVGLTAWLDARA